MVQAAEGMNEVACKKCGWIHDPGTQCPLERSLGVGEVQVESFVTHIDWLIHDGFNQMIQAVIAQRDRIVELQRVLRLCDAAIMGGHDAPTLNSAKKAIKKLRL